MADGRIKQNKSVEKRKKQSETLKRNGKPTGPRSRYITMSIGLKLDVIKGWIANGATHKEIADNFGVSAAIISQWKTAHPEFKQAMESNKPEAVGKVIASAFDQAVGYERPEKQVIKLRKEWYEEIAQRPVRFMEEFVEEITVMKYYPPNPKMTEFLLVNWDPEHFKRINDVAAESGKKLEDYFSNFDEKGAADDITTTRTEKEGSMESIKQ